MLDKVNRFTSVFIFFKIYIFRSDYFKYDQPESACLNCMNINPTKILKIEHETNNR